MEVVTADQWDESLWNEAEPIYYAAFPEHGRKKREIIQNMFHKKLCMLHLARMDDQTVAMALTGKADHSHALIIDYFAVREEHRGKGVGALFLETIKRWAKEQGTFKLLLIEVEAEDNQTNQKRTHFWANMGFLETAYVHRYIWVPEPYRAMYLPLGNGSFSTDGRHLFSHITRFHKESFTKTQT